jgi:hypothetical protein
MEWCTCADDSSFDDAGQPTGCLRFVACVQSCLYPPADSGVDAGTVSACSSQCMQATSTSINQAMEGGNLLACIYGSCAATTQCGQ